MISVGTETKETQGGVKLMTGLVPMMVVAVNPSKKELEAKLAKQENQYNALLEKVEMLTKQIENK